VLEELPPERFGELIPLYEEVGGMFPIIRAVLEGGQRGQVFASADRGCAFIVNGFGFARLLERDGGAHDDQLLAMLSAPGPIRPSYILWYDPPARWQERLRTFENIRVRERLRYDFRLQRAAYVDDAEQLPAGSELHMVDAALLPKAEKFGLALDSRFWSSAEDFVANALPVAVVQGGEIASLCYAAAVGGNLAEVDVVTDEAIRGAGLGSMAARQFVRECVRRGITPAWDCFTYNQGSMKLAEKLGFVPLTTYNFYTFNIPVAAARGNG
jgi:RimJ/RimL family protein N-acetyltransferase